MTEYDGAERSTTDILRQLLDERGVEWGDRFAGEPQSSYTRYEVDSGMSVTAWEDTFTGKLGLSVEIDYRLTPEQAVEATLGRGTCHIEPFEMERDTGYFDTMQCECGHVADVADWAAWRFCPRRGREVVE